MVKAGACLVVDFARVALDWVHGEFFYYLLFGEFVGDFGYALDGGEGVVGDLGGLPEGDGLVVGVLEVEEVFFGYGGVFSECCQSHFIGGS